VRKVDVETGKVIWKRHLPKRFFGEGLAVIPRNKGKEALVQLTWKESRAYVHDLSEEEGEVGRDGHLGGEDLESESDGEFFSTSLGDGWGVTNSNLKNAIIISNGTEHLTVFDVKERRVLRSVKVMDGGIRQKFVNELEKVGTEIWANILERECIARIDESTGEILGWIDFTGLKNEPGNDGFGDVMNGIAYDDTHNKIYVTGKLWKSVFEVKIRKLEGKSADVLPITRMRCRGAKTLPNYGYE
jgi:glutamine cyclotransferase